MQRHRGVTVRELGHVSFFVRDLEATRRFYRDILGLAETGTGKNGRIVFFSAGRHHHDVSCEIMRTEGSGPQPHGAPGFYHAAFDVGRSLDELGAARRWVETHGLAPFGETTTSFCVRDPDGHTIELYISEGGFAPLPTDEASLRARSRPASPQDCAGEAGARTVPGPRARLQDTA